MGITITVDTSDLDGPGYSDWMIVCYKIHNPDGFKKYDRLAVDLPADTEIMSPGRAARIDGGPTYEVDGRGPGPAGRVTQNGQQDVEICLVAKKGPMREGELSLELKRPIPVNENHFIRGQWERLPYEGAPTGIGPHELPPAMAMDLPTGNPEHAMLAQGIMTAMASRRTLVSMKDSAAPQPKFGRKSK